MIGVTNFGEGAGDILTSSVSKDLSTSGVLRNKVGDVVDLTVEDDPGGLVRALKDVVLGNFVGSVLGGHDVSELASCVD